MTDPDDPEVQERYKYGVLLNLDCSSAESFIFLTTSRIDKVEPIRDRFPVGFHDFAVGAYEWVSLPTVLDLRTYKKYPRESMLAAFKDGTLTPQGVLTPEHVEAIDAKLRLSKQIEKRVLKLIVS
jgi:hypothetical protein